MGAIFADDSWAIVLGGSSGFGLATAHALAEAGMSLCLVHRDRRGAMARIEPEFEAIRARGTRLVTRNCDALDPQRRDEVLDALADAMGDGGRVRVVLHSIAFGNLKLIAPEPTPAPRDLEALGQAVHVDPATLQAAVDECFAAGADHLYAAASPPAYSSTSYIDEEDLARTIHSMGTSLLGWTQAVHARGLFAPDARVFGLTSEGNTVAWRGYAAVSAAKTALEAVARAIAVEFAPHGVRCNVIQAGVTDTPALRAIPGHEHLMAQARLRNPFRRLTTPRDVARVITLLARDEAAWINGDVIRVDGGEHISGALQ